MDLKKKSVTYLPTKSNVDPCDVLLSIVLVWLILPVSLGCSISIAPSVFSSNVSQNKSVTYIIKSKPIAILNVRTI